MSSENHIRRFVLLVILENNENVVDLRLRILTNFFKRATKGRINMKNIQNLIEKLQKNNFDAYLVKDRAEAVQLTKELIPSGSSVACGGSMTVYESGITDLLSSGEYNYIVRKPDMTDEQIKNIFMLEKTVDWFICSSNAVTSSGELYNVDGRANRISSIANGPKNVLIVVGINKIVDDLPAAIERVKNICAPKNAKRLGCNTYCAKTGKCFGAEKGMTDGCDSPDRICCQYLISAHQRIKDRIKVIIVEESLGY